MNPLTYEECRELKDAGFPQQLGNVGADRTHYIRENDGEPVLVPSLTKLIAECGRQFGSLHQIGEGHWEAEVYSFDIGNAFSKDGDTPEQAVKNLWIALNKQHE